MCGYLHDVLKQRRTINPIYFRDTFNSAINMTPLNRVALFRINNSDLFTMLKIINQKA
jgi:hypothetical protein